MKINHHYPLIVPSTTLAQCRLERASLAWLILDLKGKKYCFLPFSISLGDSFHLKQNKMNKWETWNKNSKMICLNIMSIMILNNLNVINTVFLSEGVLVYPSWAMYWRYSGKSIDRIESVLPRGAYVHS